MSLILKSFLLTSLFSEPLLASESFGGIGVSIYQVRDGVKVAEEIPGTPTAETKLQANDVIIAVDGESLKGKSIEESKARLVEKVGIIIQDFEALRKTLAGFSKSTSENLFLGEC